jgi:hypothetical protein
MPNESSSAGAPAITRRVDLSEFGDGMDGCYAVVRLRNYQDVQEVRKQDFTKKDFDTIGYEIGVVKAHFVSGKILRFGSEGKPTLSDMTADDVDASPEIADKLYAVIMGINLDPKGSSTAAPSKGASSTSLMSTNQLSSTDQPTSAMTSPETSSSTVTPISAA